jgi:two-component system response regulator YesN
MVSLFQAEQGMEPLFVSGNSCIRRLWMDKLRILLVDDEPIIRRGIIESMDWEAEGCEIVGECCNGRDALEQLEKIHAHVVISDIRMPVMDGLELSQKVRISWPDIVFLFLTGYDDFEYAREAIKYGVSRYLLKPAGAEELIEIVREIRKDVIERENRRKEEELHRALVEDKLGLLQRDFMFGLCSGKCCESDEELVKSAASIAVDVNGPEFQVFISDPQVKAEGFRKILEKGSFSDRTSLVIWDFGENKILIMRNCSAASSGSVPFCHALKSIIEKETGLLVTISFGRKVSRIKELSLSFCEAEEAFKWKIYAGKGAVIPFVSRTRFLSCEKPENSSVDSLTDTIVNSIRKLKLGETVAVIEDLFKLYSASGTEKNIIINHLTVILNEMVIAVRENNITLLEQHRFNSNPLAAIESLETLEEWKALVLKRALFLEQAIEENERQNYSKITRKVLQYVQKNYHHSFTVQTVSEQLGITPNYLSRIFKEDMNQNFNTYVNEVRIRAAAELLRNSDKKVFEIADSTGFGDYKYFATIFKKITGMSPGEYRKAPVNQVSV